MELPIPNHLKKFLVVQGPNNSENEVTGKIRCACHGEIFSVRSSNDGGFVKLVCRQCQEELLLFDAGKQGWDGFVCKSDFLDRTQPLVAHTCPNCGENAFAVSVRLSSLGKEYFADVCIEDDGEFAIEDWVNAFDWFQITLSCAECGAVEDAWVDYETA